MKVKVLASLLVVGSLAATSASAADIGASLDVGTSGLGVHLSTPLASQLNARVGVNYASYKYSGNTSDVDYDFKLKLATFDALLDYHPFDGAFRVSGGLVYNGNKIEANAKPNGNGTYTINGNTYTSASAGSIKGKIDFRKAAPYLGIGWGNAAKGKGLGFAMDLGVTFQGSPKTQLVNSGCTAPATVCTRLNNDLAAENASLADKASNFRAYPIVRLGLSYGF
jgi:hypothetical protein